MEILFSEYRCLKCGVGVECMRSVRLAVPSELDVACPECNEKALALFAVTRMASNDDCEVVENG